MDVLTRVDAVDEAIEHLAAIDHEIEHAPDALVIGSLWTLGRDATILEATRTCFAGEWEARSLHVLDGSRSAAARLARELGVAPATARLLLRRARRLRTMPATSAAFSRGEVTADKVDLLCRANGDGREGAFADAEERLLADAGRLGVKDLGRVVQAWMDAADDAKVGGRARKDHERRHLVVAKRFDGNVDLEGRLDPVAGAAFAAEVDRLEQELFRADWAQAREIWGDDVTIARLARTATQRRADALVLMAARSAGADGTRPARPLVTIHVDHATFVRTVGTGTPKREPAVPTEQPRSSSIPCAASSRTARP